MTYHRGVLRETRESTMSETSTYRVAGMTCGHCVSSVTEELQALSGVESVDVVLPSGAVTVTSSEPIDEAAVRAAVEEAGYQLA
jgi:copper chaperone CopZ